MGIGNKLNAMAAYQQMPPGSPIPPVPPGSDADRDAKRRRLLGAHLAPAADGFSGALATSASSPSVPLPAAPDGRSVLERQVRAKFDHAVAWRSLQHLYPPSRLDDLARTVAQTVDFSAVGHQWQLPYEVSLDLCTLALYDIVIYADDSGSMSGANWSRDLMTIVQRTAAVATLFDDDGISVRFMNSRHDADHIKTEQDVLTLLKRAQPCGGTPLGTSMKAKILDPYLEQVKEQGANLTELKPLLIITVTDGAPSGERSDTVFKVIRNMRRALAGAGLTGNEVTYQFAQVGNDSDAMDFLDSLDNHPEIGPFVDATSNFEAEARQWRKRSNGESEMTRDLYLLKLLCGAIDDEWDAKDEGPHRTDGAGVPPAWYCVCL